MIKKLLATIYLLIFLGFIAGALGRFALFSDRVYVSLLDLGVSLLLIVWLIYIFFKKLPPLLPRLYYPIVFFVLALVFSYIINARSYSLIQLGIGGAYLLRWLLYVLVYFITIDFLNRRIIQRQLVIWGLLISGLSIAAVGIIQYIFFPSLKTWEEFGWDPHAYRLFSTLLDANFAGMVIVLTLILWVARLYKQKQRMTFFLICILCMVALGLTFSRSSYLAFYLSLPLVLGKSHKRLLGFMLLFFTAFIVFWPRPATEGTNLRRTATVTSRINNMQEAVKIIMARPIFGAGYNMYEFVRPSAKLLGPEYFSPLHSRAGADNSYLFVWATVGIIGLAIFLRLLVALFFSPSADWVVKASIFSVAIHSFFVNSLFYPWVMVWMWLLVAAIEVRDYS
ncbi:O-antigen ligase family protein [Candidatus Woesebacteria bacterium]|nr:O-antigen ligase family protein [Candidatus Woesebacteria bacterium]